MISKRVIPCLLLKEDGLVKGKQFKDHRYVGDPINTVKLFNDKEVDELVFLDIEASLENREPTSN
jgi:cyclase